MEVVRLNNNDIVDYYIKNIIVSSNIKLMSSNIQVYYVENIRILKEYNTIISLINCNNNYNKIYINNSKYSKTTTRLQNKLKSMATIEKMEIVELEEVAMYRKLEEVL